MLWYGKAVKCAAFLHTTIMRFLDFYLAILNIKLVTAVIFPFHIICYPFINDCLGFRDDFLDHFGVTLV